MPSQSSHSQIVRSYGIRYEFFMNSILASKLHNNNFMINYKECINRFHTRHDSTK